MQDRLVSDHLRLAPPYEAGPEARAVLGNRE